MDRWIGRVALVTGASSGIGAAVCRDLVKHGMKVVGCARSVDKIQKIAADLKSCKGVLYPIKCDLTEESDILSVFQFIRKELGRIDVCVNNAGFSGECTLLKGKTEDWRNMFNVNVLAMCICGRESINLMKEKNIKDGHVINISSIAGNVVLSQVGSFYCGTKFMVNALTEGLRQELRSEKSTIRVTCICPGYVETEFLSVMFKGSKEAEKAVLDSIGNIKGLSGENISSAVKTVLMAPPHVDINTMVIRPSEQEL